MTIIDLLFLASEDPQFLLGLLQLAILWGSLGTWGIFHYADRLRVHEREVRYLENRLGDLIVIHRQESCRCAKEPDLDYPGNHEFSCPVYLADYIARVVLRRKEGLRRGGAA
jgi:hypothetical protein